MQKQVVQMIICFWYMVSYNHTPFNYLLKTFQTAYLAPLSRVY